MAHKQNQMFPVNNVEIDDFLSVAFLVALSQKGCRKLNLELDVVFEF